MTSLQNYRLGIDIALRCADDETNRSQSLDTKAILIIGFTGVLAGLQFNIFNALSKIPNGVDEGFNIFFIITAITNACSTIFALAVTWMRKYKGGPGGSFLETNVDNLSSNDFHEILLESYTLSYEANHHVNQEKALFLLLSQISLAICIITITLAYIKMIWG